MPYSTRWGMTATKVTGGTFDVHHPDSPLSPVRLTAIQVFPSDQINAGYCLFLAIDALFPMLPGLWRNRYLYSVAQWKLAAYQNLAAAASGQTRTALTAKRNYWVGEESRLKALMGVDA